MTKQGTAERFGDEGGSGLSPPKKRQALLSESFFEDTIVDLRRTRAEHNLEAWQELVEQARRRQETGRVLARESVNAYAGFLDSLFSYYRESVRATREG